MPIDVFISLYSPIGTKVETSYLMRYGEHPKSYRMGDQQPTQKKRKKYATMAYLNSNVRFNDHLEKE